MPKSLTEPSIAVRLDLESIAHRGKCVARADGKATFVQFGIPGERVEAEIFKSYKRYSEAEIICVVHASEDRVQPRCSHFGICGGCHLQHMSYERQLLEKRKVVQDLLFRIGGFDKVDVKPVVPSPRQYAYRNTARFHVGSGGEIGFTDWKSNSFFQAHECPVMEPQIEAVLSEYSGSAVPGKTVRVRHSAATNELLVSARRATLEEGWVGTRHNILGHEFRVSANSFFQINTPQAEALVRLAIEGLRPLKGQTVLDAYCGVGTFTRFLAEEATKVTGVDTSGFALRDAAYNLEGLGVTLLQGRAEDVVSQLDVRPSRVLLDPPRTGCESPLIRALLELKAERVVYISCEPSTLARDLKALCSSGAYSLLYIQPVDMFPQTYHIECVAALRSSLTRKVI